MLVSLPDGKGVGKLDGTSGDTCSVSIFRSIIRSDVIRMPVAAVSRAYLSPQTRVYVRDGGRFRVGRISDFFIGDRGLVDYEVRFPNGKRADFSELCLYIRPWSAPDDPAEILASGGAESQFLHDRRQAALLPLLKLRSAAQGMTALVSAGIELAPHQVAAVRRVLSDPVQRYLLADEVGLGKTIEAGLIVRQHLIDSPETSVLVAVPAHLCAQWRKELGTKLRLDQFDTIEVVTHADLANTRVAPAILVVDEAHHLVGVDSGPLAPAAAKLRIMTRDAPVVLLLSATPALGDEARFLALLNLLDPTSHPLDDVPGFRRKLERRRDIGRLLLALDPEAPKLVLRQRGAEMERLFPEDQTIKELAPRLIQATRDAPHELPTLCAALRNHIADSYRIHQRLIRSRRADAQGWEFSPRGPADQGEPSFAHVRVEAEATSWVKPLLPILEEWRFGALEAASGDKCALDEAALRYADLLTAIGGGRSRLIDWVANERARTTFADEPPILERLCMHARDSSTGNDYATACESTLRLIRSLRSAGSVPKIVAFSSSVVGATNFHKALRDTLRDCEILLLTGDGTMSDHEAIAAFASSRTPAVLICDRNGEEGLNLAFADAIIHLDLPLSAARMEQRIGRLDRFGRRHGMIRHRVMLPDDEDDSPWTGWSDFLCHGLAIFHCSISDVQFLLEDFERQVFRALLEQGPSGVQALWAEVGEAIKVERRSQDEQYALDRIALAEEPVEAFIQGLEDAEEDEAALEDGVDQWLVGALLLKKWPVAWPAQDPFKLGATKTTLIPSQPWLEVFALEGKQALTWRRRIASGHPGTMLLRPGTPLIDMAERFTRWDDRGTAFITWRTASEWSNDLWLGFRLCFVVEPDVAISDMLAPSRAELANLRRAQRYLSPRAICIHVDSDGDLVEDAGLLSILTRPYRKANALWEPDADINLSSRPHILNNVIDPGQFGSICRTVRDRSRGLLLAEKTLVDVVDAAERLVLLEVERRRNRLRQRHSAGDFSAFGDLEDIEAILPAVVKPVVRLDAMGCFLVSRDPPRLKHMRELEGAEAFDALRRLLAVEPQEEWQASSEPSIERLRVALGGVTAQASELDLAVMLRQALRREDARRGYEVSPRVIVKHPRLAEFLAWKRVGLASDPIVGGFRVSANVWRPDWLRAEGLLGVDDVAASEVVRRSFGGQDCTGDPFLAAIGRVCYRSRGQRAAVRAALSTPPGATLVIALATGEGKSMVFQLIHAVGFVGELASASRGVTLVIVPTVALGVNHEEEALGVCGLARPLAYQSGASAANATLAERIAGGIQGLCFASPEAACGPLRTALRKAAGAGQLRAMVIDEAHLVDQWGTGFRTEFQELSGLRQELLAASPSGGELRTVLLSATLTAQSRDTLKALFGIGEAFESISAVRLRSEPDYWVAKADESARHSRVMEALHHVPRPAVLYVTEVAHAEAWRRKLRDAGFNRVGMLHGKSSREDRERIVANWREGALDVVIGTSAFGLGIDYAHARSVIHACVPETLDRFYQEVGRGGRDGKASLSLIVPAPSDFPIAERISQQKVITVDRGLERWTALFAGKRPLGDNRFAVRVDGSPGVTEDDIDMTGDWNADWNLRTLALMARAGMVGLLGAPLSPMSEPGDWLEIEMLDDEHLKRETWERRVEPVRASAQASNLRNFELMQRFTADTECPAGILEQLYGHDEVARTCSSCSRCRSYESARRPDFPTAEPRSPWLLPMPHLLARLFDVDGRLLVTYGEVSGRAESRRLGDTLERLYRMGLAKLIQMGEAPFDLGRVLRFAQNSPFFVSQLPSPVHSRLPAGPELVLVGRDHPLGETVYAPLPGRRRLFLVPENLRAQSGHLLREVFGGRVLTLDEFHARVSE